MRPICPAAAHPLAPWASVPVLQLSVGGEFICEFKSATDAAIKLNIQRPNISACCRGRHKSIGGYVWRYKNKIYDKTSLVNDEVFRW